MQRLAAILIVILFNLPVPTVGQTGFSLSTGPSLQRSFKKDQRFWAFGQDVVMTWHLDHHEGVYASLCYYSNGKFTNSLSASAKAPATLPQEIFFTDKAQVRLQQISLGWRHYFFGAEDAEANWNLYGIAGFGLIFGKAGNVYSIAIDTSLYDTPQQPVNGSGHFKRLTLDLGLGCEIPLGGYIYFYTEAKTWIPTTDYPSKYLYVNSHAPFAGMISAGLRILF